MQNWFVVHTQPESEHKVADALWQKDIENYYPITTVIQKIGGISREALRPLFDCFVFVRTVEDELWKLSHMKRVVNIMYWLSTPAVIKDVEIDMIKRFTREHKCVRAETIEPNPNEVVRIVREPVRVKENIAFTTLVHDERLLLPSLCYRLVASTESGKIININNTAGSFEHAQES